MKLKKTKKVKKEAKPANGAKLPNKQECSVCKKSKSVRADILEKRIIQYGSLEKCLAEYECRECRKGPDSKAPPTKKRKKRKGLLLGESINEVTGETNYFWQDPYWKGFTQSPSIDLSVSRENYERGAGQSCWRPDIFIKNGKFCDSCTLYATCACPLRRLRKEGVRIDLETNEEVPLSYYMRKKLNLIAPKARQAASIGKKLSYYTRKKQGLLKWTKKKK